MSGIRHAEPVEACALRSASFDKLRTLNCGVPYKKGLKFLHSRPFAATRLTRTSRTDEARLKSEMLRGVWAQLALRVIGPILIRAYLSAR